MANGSTTPPDDYGYGQAFGQQTTVQPQTIGQPATTATTATGQPNDYGYGGAFHPQTTTTTAATTTTPFVNPRDVARRTTQTVSTPMDVVRSFEDPLGIGASVAQGASLDLAGEAFPSVKARADAYAQAHPVASQLYGGAGMVGGQVAGGELADLAAGTRAIAASPLARTLVRYALPTTEGGWWGYHETPADAPPGTATANTILGAALGAGGQRAGELASNVVNRIVTNRMPAWTPTWPDIRNALGKLGSGYVTSWGARHLMPDLSSLGEIGTLAQEAVPHLLGMGESLREGVMGDIGSAARDLYGNVTGWLRTPTGLGRTPTGRFMPRIATPTPIRSAIPGAVLAPPLASAGANSDLAKIMADFPAWGT